MSGTGQIGPEVADLAALFALDPGALGQLAAFDRRHPEIRDLVAVRIREHVTRLRPDHPSRSVFETLPLERMANLTRILLSGRLDQELLDYGAARMQHYDAQGVDMKILFPWASVVPAAVADLAERVGYDPDTVRGLERAAHNVGLVLLITMIDVFIQGRDSQLVSFDHLLNASGAVTGVAGSLVSLAGDGQGGLVRVIESVHAALDRVEAGAADVSNVVTQIRGTAEQTNLLALNASIEAARAGTEGRGFGVVAMEVKDLARTTAELLTRIEDSVERMHAQVEEASGVVGDADASSTQIQAAAEQLYVISRELSAASGS